MSNKSQTMGLAIMAASILQLVVFFVAAARKSYAAVAIPIAIALAGLSALGFWIGWTMTTTEADLDGLEFDEEFAGSGLAQNEGQ